MKKIIILTIGLFFLTLHGLKAQEDQPLNHRYRFFYEYGTFIGSTYDSGDLGFSCVLVNGLQIKNAHFFGLGLGYENGFFTIGRGIPMFLDYRHIFDRGHPVKMFINTAMGMRVAFWDQNRYYFYGYDSEQVSDTGLGSHLSLGAGLIYHAFSFSSSFFHRTRPGDYLIGFELKVGYTF